MFRRKALVVFIPIGLTFIVIGISGGSGRRAFLFIGVVFIVLGLAALSRRRG